MLLLATSAALAGCDPPRDCVDSIGRKMPDSYCHPGTPGGGHYVYGGRSGGRIGDVVTGGSSSRVGGILRGGFGRGGSGSGGE